VDIGYICEHQRKYGEALKYFLSALKLRQEIGWKPAIAGAYNDLAIAYLKQSNYSEALKNGRLALKINEEIQTSGVSLFPIGISQKFTAITVIIQKL
jgi:tetratricopeptide (TPR) repeat protein